LEIRKVLGVQEKWFGVQEEAVIGDYDSATTQVSSSPIARSMPKHNNIKLKHLNDYDCTIKGII